MANPYIVIEQKDEKKKRSGLAIILAVAFAAILAIGGTFAYLTYTANQTPNRFTTDPNITADVLEPMWTNKIDNSTTASDGEKIPVAADNMMPGSEVAKNPFVVNTSKNGSKEYAGLKLQFQKYVQPGESTDASKDGYVNMTASEVAALFKVYAFAGTEAAATGSKTTGAGWTTGTGWTQILSADDTAVGTGVTAGLANSDGAMYFYYGTALTAETSSQVTSESQSDNYWNIPSATRTAPLFTFVRYANGATQADINALNKILKSGKSLNDGTGNYTSDPGWRVVISGAAIQATDDNTAASHAATDAAEKWTTLLDANSKTDGTSTTSKPTTASGVRADSSLSPNIPEASNIKPDGSKAS